MHEQDDWNIHVSIDLSIAYAKCANSIWIIVWWCMQKSLFPPHYLHFAHEQLAQLLLGQKQFKYIHFMWIGMLKCSFMCCFQLSHSCLTIKCFLIYRNGRIYLLFMNEVEWWLFMMNWFLFCFVSFGFVLDNYIDDKYWQTPWNGEIQPVSICQPSYHGCRFECGRRNCAELCDRHFGRGNRRPQFWCWR